MDINSHGSDFQSSDLFAVALAMSSSHIFSGYHGGIIVEEEVVPAVDFYPLLPMAAAFLSVLHIVPKISFQTKRFS